jgi:hypothetical protein
MWNFVKLSTAVILSHFLVCCTTSPPPVREIESPGEVAFPEPDSLATISYDFLFIQLHADILLHLERLETDHQSSARLIEAKSIVHAAEQIYLEGKHIVAIELLTEAEELLRTIP